MRIKVDVKIFFIIILYIFMQSTKIFALTFIFILLHELGHLVTGITIGLKVKKINMHISGLSVEFENYGKQRNANKIVVDIAGPLINIIALVIAIIIKQEEIAYINLLLAIVNLLPIYPLDGGRILRTLLRKRFTYKETINFIESISQYTLIILTAIASCYLLIGKNIGIFIAILYLWTIFFKEKRKNQIIRKAIRSVENNT